MVVGGLSLSAVLTLLIIPPMLTMMVGTLERAPEPMAKPNRGRKGGKLPPAQSEPIAGE